MRPLWFIEQVPGQLYSAGYTGKAKKKEERKRERGRRKEVLTTVALKWITYPV